MSYRLHKQDTPKHFGWKKCLSSTALKIRKCLLNGHKMGGAHHQYVNNHYEKFEYKVMNTEGVRLHKLGTS